MVIRLNILLAQKEKFNWSLMDIHIIATLLKRIERHIIVYRTERLGLFFFFLVEICFVFVFNQSGYYFFSNRCMAKARVIGKNDHFELVDVLHNHEAVLPRRASGEAKRLIAIQRLKKIGYHKRK